MRILVTDHVFGGLDRERAVLEPLGAELVLAPDTDERTLAELARGCAGMLVCYAPVTAAVVDAAAEGGCRVIARYGIGYDNVDIATATAHGIVVTYVPDYCLDEVADHTMALLIGAARGVVAAAADVRAGGWTVPQGAVHRLAGRRLALLGLGGIGRRVAARARAFGLEITGYDPYVEPGDVPGVAPAASIEEAVAEADMVSLHLPLGETTRGIVGDELIAAMRRAPILVNTARGGLIDADAVARALDAGSLSWAALDVMPQEPPPADHPLRGHPRAILTPHMAFYSVEAQAELQRRAAEEVARGLRGEPPDRPVNPEALRARASAR